MPTLLRVAHAVDRFHAALGRAVSWLVLLMVVVGAFNAVARYGGRSFGMNLASNGWLELQWYLFSLVFLLAAPDALRRNAHVRVDVLYGRLGERPRAWIDLIGGVVFLVPFCVFAVWASLPTVLASFEVWEQSPDPGGLPRYPLKGVIPVAFALLGVQGLAEVVKAAARLRGARDGEAA